MGEKGTIMPFKNPWASTWKYLEGYTVNHAVAPNQAKWNSVGEATRLLWICWAKGLLFVLCNSLTLSLTLSRHKQPA